jgi:hypothetical protein
MYFKLEVILNSLSINLSEQQPLTLAIEDEQHTSIVIRVLTPEEKQQYKKEYFLCTAMTQEQPEGDTYAAFQCLADNLMPDGFRLPKDQFQKYINEMGRITKGHNVSLELFPKPFQEFSSRVHHKLSESIRRAVKILRWRMALRVSHQPIVSSHGVSWSFDDKTWQRMPADFDADIELLLFPRVSGKIQSEIETFIKTEQSEPLAHELFLEAWELRNNNPRSALIIGMSAAEVGFKQCVGKLVPDAEWLANNAPTPPLDRMLSNYLPILPAKLKIEGKVLKPSKKIRVAIRKGIEARNTSVHVGAEPPKRHELKELLLSIRDLLYLLDFYCGFEWALDHIRDEIRKEMVSEFDLKSTEPFSVIELG